MLADWQQTPLQSALQRQLQKIEKETLQRQYVGKNANQERLRHQANVVPYIMQGKHESLREKKYRMGGRQNS